MGEVSVRSLTHYPYALNAGPWAWRRMARVDVHISRAAIRIEPHGWQASRVPQLLIPMDLVTGMQSRSGLVWIRTRDDRGDPVGLGGTTSQPRIAAALRALEVPDEWSGQRRDRGFWRPGSALLALLVAAFFVARSVVDTRWGLLGLAAMLVIPVLVITLTTVGPHGGHRLVLTSEGWVEQAQSEQLPA